MNKILELKCFRFDNIDSDDNYKSILWVKDYISGYKAACDKGMRSGAVVQFIRNKYGFETEAELRKQKQRLSILRAIETMSEYELEKEVRRRLNTKTKRQKLGFKDGELNAILNDPEKVETFPQPLTSMAWI